MAVNTRIVFLSRKDIIKVYFKLCLTLKKLQNSIELKFDDFEHFFLHYYCTLNRHFHHKLSFKKIV